MAHLEQIATHLLIIDEAEVKFWGTMAEFMAGRETILSDALLQLLAPTTSTHDLTWLTNQAAG